MLVGSEERKAQQILRPYRCPCRERAVFSHQHAPNVRHRQLDEVVLRQIRRFDEDAEIHKPPVQPFRDVIRIAAEQVVRNVGVRRLEPVRRAGNQRFALAFYNIIGEHDGLYLRAVQQLFKSCRGMRCGPHVPHLARPDGILNGRSRAVRRKGQPEFLWLQVVHLIYFYVICAQIAQARLNIRRHGLVGTRHGFACQNKFFAQPALQRLAQKFF